MDHGVRVSEILADSFTSQVYQSLPDIQLKDKVIQLGFALGNIRYICCTPILLDAKMISLCHQYRARADCTSVHSDQALYCWLTNFKFSSYDLNIPKNDNGQFLKLKVDYSI